MSTATNNSEDKMSHFFELLDDVEHQVEEYRDRAIKLLEDGHMLAKTLSTLESLPDDLGLSAVEQEEAKAHVGRVRSRLGAINVSVSTQRDQVQADALSQVQSVISRLVDDIQQDCPDTAATLQRYLTSNDGRFERLLLSCTSDDQKEIKRQLNLLSQHVEVLSAKTDNDHGSNEESNETERESAAQ